jgi:hypothetical protein
MVDLPFSVEFGDFRIVVEELSETYRWTLFNSDGYGLKWDYSQSVESCLSDAFKFLDLENY